MVLLKYLLFIGGFGLMAVALAVLTYDLSLLFIYRRAVKSGASLDAVTSRPLRWRMIIALLILGWMPVLLALGIIIIPSGKAAVRVSKSSGVKAGTLYPGAHFLIPFAEDVAVFDIRDQVYSTAGPQAPARKGETTENQPSPFFAQSREGLNIGLSLTIRYRLDPNRLDHIEATLPEDLDHEVVAPTLDATFRDLAPGYTVRELFSTKREEVRRRALDVLKNKLEPDGILIKDVSIRDVQLPPEFARGLEELLMKEQENDRMSVETELHAKHVKIAELDAEARKVEQIKNAEAMAQVRLLQAKGESDAMQYTLPLKQKQIEQTRLESEAQKENIIKNAEANAEAKIIDSKAELQRRNLLSEAEANHIRLTSAADAERLRAEALVLKQNPLLINKIMAEKLSDKLQIMMVPADGKFFMSDMLRGLQTNAVQDDTDPQPQTHR